MRLMTPIILLTLLLVSLEGYALNPGEEAPELTISKWVKNGPVKLADGKGKKIYIIEFWATWCPPCRQSIPHLSKLQKKYKDKIEIAGISQEEIETVEKFVENQKDMNYHVAVDDKGQTTKAYMKGMSGIPTAFVIDKNGIVQWKGHPLKLESVISKVIEGNFDIKTYKKISDLHDSMQATLRAGKIDKVTDTAKEILDLDPTDDMALRIMLYSFKEKGENLKAITFVKELIGKSPESPSLYFVLLDLINESGTKEQLREEITKIIDKFKKSKPSVLNDLAWGLMNYDFSTAQLDLALKAAKLSIENLPEDANPEKQSAFLDTLARAYYSIGCMEKAYDTQQKACNLVSGVEKLKAQKTLEFYMSVIEIRDNNQ